MYKNPTNYTTEGLGDSLTGMDAQLISVKFNEFTTVCSTYIVNSLNFTLISCAYIPAQI